MSAATIFDTLHYANKLKQAGVPAAHAEAQAEALACIFEDKLATKQELKSGLSHLGSDLRREMSELKVDFIKWMIGLTLGLMAAQTGILVAAMKFFH
jgi:hypothetical protein